MWGGKWLGDVRWLALWFCQVCQVCPCFEVKSLYKGTSQAQYRHPRSAIQLQAWPSWQNEPFEKIKTQTVSAVAGYTMSTESLLSAPLKGHLGHLIKLHQIIYIYIIYTLYIHYIYIIYTLYIIYIYMYYICMYIYIHNYAWVFGESGGSTVRIIGLSPPTVWNPMVPAVAFLQFAALG